MKIRNISERENNKNISFDSDVKELYEMRYIQYKGLAKMKMELIFKFICINLKNYQFENRKIIHFLF